MAWFGRNRCTCKVVRVGSSSWARRGLELQDVLVLARYGSGDDKLILHVTGRGWRKTIMWWSGVKSVVGSADLPFWVSVVMVVVKTREK